MDPKRFVRFFFGNWVVPVVAYVPILQAFIVLGLMRSSVAEIMGMVILCLGLLWLVSSSVHQFRQKRWARGLATLAVMFGGTIMALIVYVVLSTAVTMIDGDHWADNLTIPEGIELSEPLEAIAFIPDSGAVVPDLLLYNSHQPGIYKYAVRVDRLGPGNAYLKAFEITQGTQLSAESLEKRSLMSLSNPSGEPALFRSDKSFTIYEGDWGKPYAARFEVWFKPAAGGQEVKLLEKNYKIEGWMH